MSKTGNCTAPRGLAHRLLVLIISFFPAPNALALGVHVGGGHALEGPRPIVAPLLLSPLRWNSHPCLSCSVAARSRAQSNHLSSARPLRQKHAPPPHMMSPTHTKDLTRWCPPSVPPPSTPSVFVLRVCVPPGVLISRRSASFFVSHKTVNASALHSPAHTASRYARPSVVRKEQR